jgi:hypothetical protein
LDRIFQHKHKKHKHKKHSSDEDDQQSEDEGSFKEEAEEDGNVGDDEGGNESEDEQPIDCPLLPPMPSFGQGISADLQRERSRKARKFLVDQCANHARGSNYCRRYVRFFEIYDIFSDNILKIRCEFYLGTFWRAIRCQ